MSSLFLLCSNVGKLQTASSLPGNTPLSTHSGLKILLLLLTSKKCYTLCLLCFLTFWRSYSGSWIFKDLTSPGVALVFLLNCNFSLSDIIYETSRALEVQFIHQSVFQVMLFEISLPEQNLYGLQNVPFHLTPCLTQAEKDNLKGGSERETCSKDLLQYVTIQMSLEFYVC